MPTAPRPVIPDTESSTEVTLDAELLRLVEHSAARVGLGPVDALALSIVTTELLSLVRGLPWRGRARVVERGEALAATVELAVQIPEALRTNGDDREEALRRAATQLPSRVEGVVERAGEQTRVRLAAARARGSGLGPRGADAPFGDGARTLRARAMAALEELERQGAELERVRAELSDTSRGALAVQGKLSACERELLEERRRKDELMDMLAHELRNPVATIQLAANDAERGGMSDRGQDIVREQAEHLRRMVDDLLDAAQLANGRVELHCAPVELGRLVTRVVEAHRDHVERDGRTLRLVVPSTPTWVEGDERRLDQMLAHLLKNAAKYTTPPGRVDVTLAAHADHAELAVRDTGRGMTPEERADAFELFVQHGQGLERADGGLGLGLPMVREIATRHGGTVVAVSDGPGRGSTFEVRLPILTGDPVASDTPQRKVRRPMQVLLVEDHDDLRELLAARLRRRGWHVEESANGSDALERLRRGPLPDVVVTDVGLPGMDGYALARAIRSDPELEHLRLVALTGYGGSAAAARTREAGFDAHLVKPVRLEVLFDALGGPR